MFERPNWLTRKLARSNSLAAREEIVTDFKVSSDLLQLKSGHSENFNWTSHVHSSYFAVRPRCTTLNAIDLQLRVRTLLLYHTTQINIAEDNKNKNNCRVEGD